jgi:hypothetical protein
MLREMLNDIGIGDRNERGSDDAAAAQVSAGGPRI